MKNDFDELLDNEFSRIEKDLRNPNPPKVKFYYTKKKEKKISVQYDFDLGLIKRVKLIADFKEWIEIYENLDDFDFSFDNIKFIFSRPKRALTAALKNYAEQCPEGFCNDVIACVKTVGTYKRKQGKHSLSFEERNEVSAQAAYLYVFLTDASKVSEDNWPDYFIKFCKEYQFGYLNLKKPGDRQEAVRIVLSKYHGIDLGERFFQTYVTESRINLARIKKLKAIHRSPIDNPHLKPLFQEFI
jgi:hypothetical protein